MPQLSGFAKTYRFNLLVSPGVADQFSLTVEQYRRAVSFYLQVFQNHQEILDRRDWLRTAEILTHYTKKNPNPKYDFDSPFPNYPSGLRRAAISEACGSACSWRSNYKRWQAKKEKHDQKNRQREIAGKCPILFTEHPPQYPLECNRWPSFYGTEHRMLDEHHVLFKLFTGRAYVYRKVALLAPLVAPEGYAAGSPSLVRKAWGWELHVPVALKQRLYLQKISNQFHKPGFRFCSVDLGINNHAVMTIQDAEGRVLATEIISGARDSHLRKRHLEEIAKLQKQTRVIPGGERFAKDLWDKVSNFNDDLAHQVSRRIVNFAKKHGAAVIVFEHLENLKPEKRTRSHWLNRKLGHWVKARIFRYTRYKALHAGILTARVSPRDTSSRCPYCGFLAIERYTPGKPGGVKLARCTNCGVGDINSDFVGSLGIGRTFIFKQKALSSDGKAS
jgi:IS605 OrfB family transposase